MALPFPAGLITLIGSGWCRLHPFIEITLNDPGSTTLYYSTIAITADSRTYVNNLKGVNGGKMSLGRSVDRVTLTVYNADAEAGRAMIAPVNYLQRAHAVIGTIYVNINDAAEIYRVEEDTGAVTAGGATDEELELLFISDTYVEETIAGDTPILKTCGWRYKGVECGYVGGIATCDQTFDGANGCRAHFDATTAEERFGGHALFIDESDVQQITNDGGGGGDDGGGGGGSYGLPWKNDVYFENY